jgi:membrane protein required for beta-lactamase induction
MDTAQTILTGGDQTQQIQSVSNTVLWIAAIAGGVILVWLIVKATTKAKG